MGDRCLRCNACTINCPVARIIGADVFPGPRFFNNISRSLQWTDFEFLQDTLLFCTSCGKCEEICPYDIDVCPTELRKQLFDKTTKVPRHASLLDTVARTGFAIEGELAIARSETQDPDVLLFPGCLVGIRMPEVARASFTLMDVFDVSFAIPEGWNCCGSTVAKLGAHELSRQLREKNVQAFEKVGAEIIVTLCPGCASHLRCTCDGFDVYHIVEYLGEVVEVDAVAEHLAKHHKARSISPAAIHYPCHVLRGGNPLSKTYLHRLAALVAHPVDTEDLCCGAGGGVLSGASFLAKMLRERKLRDIGLIEQLITACPFCLINLREGAEELGLPIRARHIVESLADVIFR